MNGSANKKINLQAADIHYTREILKNYQGEKKSKTQGQRKPPVIKFLFSFRLLYIFQCLVNSAMVTYLICFAFVLDYLYKTNERAKMKEKNRKVCKYCSRPSTHPSIYPNPKGNQPQISHFPAPSKRMLRQKI